MPLFKFAPTWDENKKIVFRTDPTKIDEDLANFPLVIRLAASATLDAQDLTAIFDELGANRKRIAVFAGGGQGAGTQCYVEIEKWDNTGEEAILHVKIPSIDDTNATEIHLYYDNSRPDNTAYVGDTGSTAAQNVWDGNFMGVYHMAQAPPGTDVIKDSTSNGNHGDTSNMDAGNLVDGKCGKALAFNGTDERVIVGNDASLKLTDSKLTIEALVYYTASSTYDPILVKRLNTQIEYQLHIVNSNRNLVCYWTQGGSLKTRTASNTATLDAWNFLAAAIDGVAGTAQMFVDLNTGSAGDTSASPFNTYDVDVVLGNDNTTSQSWLEGKGCEFRLSKIKRADAWLKATYYSLFDQLLTVNLPPATPSVTDVTEGGQQAIFTGSAFSDPDTGDSHYASQWQVDLQSGNFSSPVVDSGEDTTHKTSYAATGLQYQTAYKVRVRYKDNSGLPNCWSAWSAAVNFTTLPMAAKPDTPTATVDEIHQTACTLHGSAFHSAIGAHHHASQWQVDEQAGDWTTPVIDTGEDHTNLTSYPATGLTGLTDYKARVRYKDDSGDPVNEWSEWSTPANFTTEGAWTGIVFTNRTPPDQSLQVPDGTAISCEVTDNWYPLANADIKITIEGTQYTSTSPEVSYQTITHGKRITWTPPSSYKYGRGNEVNVRVDAKNSHNDESYTQWLFFGLRFASGTQTETSFWFRIASIGMAEIHEAYRLATQQGAQLAQLFRRATGMVGPETGAFQLVFRIGDRLTGTGECEPTVFVCQMKRIQGQGGGNVAEVERLAGHGSADIYGAYLITGGGSANLQAYMIFVTPAGSGDIVVTFTGLGEGSADVGIPFRLDRPGSANVYRVEGTTYIRINALPDAIKQALQNAGIIINE